MAVDGCTYLCHCDAAVQPLSKVVDHPAWIFQDSPVFQGRVPDSPLS